MKNSQKLEKYAELLKKSQALISSNDKDISNMANLCALIKETFNFLWVGFYLVDRDKNELFLGPFQGPVACTRIPFGKGVCGSAWKERKLLNVSDVLKFEGHIACSSESRSEIVIPIIKNDQVISVLDIDSREPSSFDETDETYLKKICQNL